MAKSKFDKKSCLRFKLVHRSVRTEADELESNLTDAGVGVPREEEGHLYAADREFVPINQKSSENIVSF